MDSHLKYGFHASLVLNPFQSPTQTHTLTKADSKSCPLYTTSSTRALSHRTRSSVSNRNSQIYSSSASCDSVAYVRDRKRVTRLLELLLPSYYSASSQKSISAHRAEIHALISALEVSFQLKLQQVNNNSAVKSDENTHWFGTFELLYSKSDKTEIKPRNFINKFIHYFLFRFTNRFQIWIPRTFIVNVIRFRALQFFSGSITRRGRFKSELESISDASSSSLARFEPPRLTIGRALNIKAGNESEISIRTTYLDDRLRILRFPHSRQALRVYIRTPPGSSAYQLASEWKAHYAAFPLRKRLAAAGIVLFSIGCCLIGWTLGGPSLSALALCFIPLAILAAAKVLAIVLDPLSA
mmetsp:Transcript_8424/g.15245  ORF Transcript_8424/g.15245 Transcript_8424/m.15245 type:complete len:354 (-) Transcript_8424:623-1684(-)|eukprot:CAMPEP_0182447496 /NCGR_PEP_ID=MMETSP1172-20130603/16704_1 /TAXON_ID=708627 /ORGANISM="Timspurckia oligopyrenoides, Strain CCMP3278" /LENGTH=353 /DNA_ID=CAMNT_0024643955 /DNA_START=26 /DNA_END=1087 /DNA_ORIENTATION=-